ncbi:hypothetical protein ACT3CE_03245 [Marinifilum sp. RC60d5]|uniref:hypothetical protein n=1 Tax=Marinifilum sp. RC60d5 TaxID=3458414 RepID=UPI0040374C76
MKFKFIKNSLLLFIFMGLCNSCSTGADPEDFIDDIFTVPLEYCLQIQNISNDMVMDVNAIVFNNLDTNKDTIDDEIASCVTPVIHRNAATSEIDSIVIDYGSSACTSNGGSFKGKMIVEPTDASLKNFELRLSDFYSQGFDIRGVMNLQIADEAGEDFTSVFSDVEFDVTDSDDVVYTFYVSEINSSYTFVKSEELDIDYVDDIFSFTTSLNGVDPNGAQFSLESSSGLTYAYSCDNIIGGNATFVLTDFGEGEVDFGGGDTDNDCDADVSVQSQGSTINFTL